MQRGARDLALRPPGNLFHKVLKPARKGNHEVGMTNGSRGPPSGGFLLPEYQFPARCCQLSNEINVN